MDHCNGLGLNLRHSCILLKKYKNKIEAKQNHRQKAAKCVFLNVWVHFLAKAYFKLTKYNIIA